MERKLHVLVTKPAVQTLQHHNELIALAKKQGVVCFVEHHKRFDPVYSDAKARAGALGEMNFFSAWMSQPKSQLETFRAWAGKDSDIRCVPHARLAPSPPLTPGPPQLLPVVAPHRHLLLDGAGPDVADARRRERRDGHRDRRAVQLRAADGGHHYAPCRLAVEDEHAPPRDGRVHGVVDRAAQVWCALGPALVLYGGEGARRHQHRRRRVSPR